MLPYVEKYEIGGGRAPSWEPAWQAAAGGCAFVLESGKDGRYTYLGTEIRSVLLGDLNEARVIAVAGGGRGETDGTAGGMAGAGISAASAQGAGTPEGDRASVPAVLRGAPLDLVKRWISPFTAPKVQGLPRFLGGIAGFWGYDVVRTIERLPVIARHDTPCPDYAFMRVDKLWIVDHEEHALYLAVHAPVSAEDDDAALFGKYQRAAAETRKMKRQWDEWMNAAADGSALGRIGRIRADIEAGRLNIDVEAVEGLQADFSREQFMEAVRRVQEYIRRGDVFQVNLSVRQRKRLDARPERVYEWLRHLNPSPYMAYLMFPDFKIVSGSPELLVQLDGRRVRTRPIAGTRPRGATEEEDARLRDELLASAKERAEHVMLVDLERNDLGRISRYGTVRVDELMTVEMYSHVMHIVSEVSGELEDGKDAFDVIRAVFPGGTITGAPKIRTMEIIEELEPVRRGPYTGSIGWIDYCGDMEFNIVIRTLLVSGGIGYVQAGAGIVIDSDAAKEYTESLNKAKALWKAIQYASLPD